MNFLNLKMVLIWARFPSPGWLGNFFFSLTVLLVKLVYAWMEIFKTHCTVWKSLYTSVEKKCHMSIWRHSKSEGIQIKCKLCNIKSTALLVNRHIHIMQVRNNAPLAQSISTPLCNLNKIKNTFCLNRIYLLRLIDL